MEQDEWHAAGDPSKPGLGVGEFPDYFIQPEPLLQVACQQEIPSMDVVCVLVEKMHVDVNTRDTEPTLRSGRWPGDQSVLHLLGRGRHWWNVALQSKQPFAEQAARTLVEHGADINAIEGCWGKSCLDLALETGDVSTFRLLLSAGATD